MKTRIEANMERSGRGEQEGPVYYGINSTARRSSQDFGGNEKNKNVINDDLADEIEAIRLAADFSSRRMLNDQKKEPTAGSASSSRLRIRALLDKQTKQRVGVSHICSNFIFYLLSSLSLSLSCGSHILYYFIFCLCRRKMIRYDSRRESLKTCQSLCGFIDENRVLQSKWKQRNYISNNMNV